MGQTSAEGGWQLLLKVRKLLSPSSISSTFFISSFYPTRKHPSQNLMVKILMVSPLFPCSACPLQLFPRAMRELAYLGARADETAKNMRHDGSELEL